MNFAYRILNTFSSVERDEALPLLLLFFHSFLNGISLILFETTANTLFLLKYNTESLPYVYIFSAIFSVIIGFIYSKLEQKSSVSSFLKFMILFILSIYILFYLIIKFTDSKLSFMFIMIFKDIVWMFAGMEFGLLIGYIFDIRQKAKDCLDF